MFSIATRAILLALLAVEPVSVPADPGIYALGPTGLTTIEPQPVVLSGGAGGISSKASFGKMDERKLMGQVLGEHAEHKVSSTPVFYYRVPEEGRNLSGAADLVLVRFKRKKNIRTFEVSATGKWKANSGVSLRSQIQIYRKKVESGLFKLVPAEDLPPGEYGFFYFRGSNLPGLIYDFSVE